MDIKSIESDIGDRMKRVLLDISQSTTRIGVVEDGELVEIHYETQRDQSLVGNIYVGRVTKVVPNLQACFVDIGASKNGYLYYGQQRTIVDEVKDQKPPKVGDCLTVQVEKDSVGNKGAMLTSKISFPGRFLVLLKESREIGISRKITDEIERKRIYQEIEKILPKEFGILVRTNGEGKNIDEFQEELIELLEKSKKLEESIFLKPPILLVEMSLPVEKAIRDFHSDQVGEFVVNHKPTYECLLEKDEFSKEGQPKLVYHEDKLPLFESYYIESQVKKALDKKVWLKSGGFLIIEETEACVVIDVNSGKSAGKGNMEKAVLKTNLEAGTEVAKQLRLRNLSGIIIIDYIDMPTIEEKNVVTKALSIAVEKDRIKTAVVGMTQLGLMQLTRKKTRASLSKQMTTRCKACEGSGKLPSIEWTIDSMRQEVESIFANTIYNQVSVEADERLLYWFCGKDKEYIKKLQQTFQGNLICKINNELGFSVYKIYKEKNSEKTQKNI